MIDGGKEHHCRYGHQNSIVMMILDAEMTTGMKRMHDNDDTS